MVTFTSRRFALALMLVGFALACIACDRSQADQFVDVGGYKLGIYCTGEGSPTVIMDAGGGSNSGSWRAVQPSIAQQTKACSYDRAGLGKSEDRLNTDIDGTFVADELHQLLVGAGLQPPFVFVGHSVGGIYVRLYDAQYPGETAGFVFVDPSHEDQFKVFDAEWQIPDFGDEGGSRIGYQPVIDELHQKKSYGAMPIIALDSGKIMNPEWLDLRRDLAQRSTNSLLVVANDAGHSIQKEAPDVVVKSIDLVVDAARTGAPLPACEPSFAGLDAKCEPVR
ncbi:MAG: alpha/beta hydrolase [Chloroflexota bacterium]